MVKPSTFAGYVELVRSISAFFRKTGGENLPDEEPPPEGERHE
jgi:hypothetical protein